MKKKTIALSILAGLFLVIIIGSIFLPTVLSSDFAKTQIPLGEKLVGKDLSKFLQGTAITVPIRGTASHPEIDKNAAQQKVSTSSQKGGQKTVEQEVFDLLQNIFKKKNDRATYSWDSVWNKNLRFHHKP